MINGVMDSTSDLSHSSTFSVTDLRSDALVNPLGFGAKAPRFSWKLSASSPSRFGLRQTAYRVLAASEPGLLVAGSADRWDSGEVATDQSVGVLYQGKLPATHERIFWKVVVTDEVGQTATSESAFFEAGPRERADWEPAQWIEGGLAGAPRTTVPSPYLRREFDLASVPANARLDITALGLYRVFINGVRVGDDELTPGWTEYEKRVQFQTYDVSALLKPGTNAIAAVLGDGWYSGSVGWDGLQRYGDRPKLLAKLSAGGETLVVTDADWHVAYGPMLIADLQIGESYDARRAWSGWDIAGFTEGVEWVPARIANVPASVALSPMVGPTVKAIQELSPISAPQVRHNGHIYDFGQNLVGRVRLRVKAPAGTTIRLRFAETLKDGPTATTGELYTDNLRTAAQTDYYTCSGDENGEVFEPLFTFHGFRFAEVTGLPRGTEASEVTAVVLHSGIAKTGDFTCSDPLINQLQKNIDWGLRGNFVDIPTDCPQRDERLGWTGDAQAFIRTATWNRDVQSFFHKWFRDIEDAQQANGSVPCVIPYTGFQPDGGPAWADAAVICPWTIYLIYGDTAAIAEQFDSMARFVDYLASISRDHIRSYDDYKDFKGFGDWLAQDGSGKIDGGTPKDLIGTAFTAYCAHLVAKMARVLGRLDDAARFEKQFEEVRAAFQHRYVTPTGFVYPGTQTAYCLALEFDLLPVEQRAAATDALARDIQSRGNKLTTGFVGSPYLPHVLTANGRVDVAYKLLHQKSWPSYLYAVTQGATTIWERWDGWTHDKGYQDKGMNSFNHYAYGAVGDWLYRSVAGIDLDESAPGYKRIVLRPHPIGSGLTSASAYLETVYGRVESGWELTEDHQFVWNVTIPANTTAIAHLPQEVRAEAKSLELVPGTHRFAFVLGDGR